MSTFFCLGGAKKVRLRHRRHTKRAAAKGCGRPDVRVLPFQYLTPKDFIKSDRVPDYHTTKPPPGQGKAHILTKSAASRDHFRKIDSFGCCFPKILNPCRNDRCSRLAYTSGI